MLRFAHRGASAHRPEHTRAAYELAIHQGADFIEPDLVVSRDGVLIVRHDVEIGQTTDVADHPLFADRRRTLVVDGQTLTGWFASDFTWAELQTLRARERIPHLRPANAAFRDEPILRFEDVVHIAQAGGVGVIPELKHPAFHAGIGLDIEALFDAACRSPACQAFPAPDDPASPAVPVILQCFEVGPLESLIGSRLQLIASAGGPADRPDLTPQAMTTPDGLRAIALYADWIGAEAPLVEAPGSTLVADAHAAGLKVAVWTMRPENAFLPPVYQRGDDPAAHGDLAARLQALETFGVDAVFTDAPGIVPARDQG